MATRKELGLSLSSLFLVLGGAVSAFYSVKDFKNLDAQVKEAQAQDRTPVVNSVDSYLDYAQTDLTYQKIVESVGSYPATTTFYPDGIDASKNMEIAVYELNKEPQIASEILSLAVKIPQSAEITIYEDSPVNQASFYKEKQEIQAIRDELKEFSDEYREKTANLQNMEDKAIYSFLLYFGVAGLGFVYPAAYLAGRSVDRNTR